MVRRKLGRYGKWAGHFCFGEGGGKRCGACGEVGDGKMYFFDFLFVLLKEWFSQSVLSFP